MSNPIIQVEHIYKQYQIGHSRSALKHRHKSTIKAAISEASQQMVKTALHPRSVSESEPVEEPGQLWALSDVSFQVNEGDRIGLIGPNGAGKSVLLKLMTQITPPTRGRILLHGRVGSVLSVSLGVNPDMNGKETIYFVGALMGMSQRHVRKHYDDIVAFSNLDKFLETPVKRYSSGMNIRLAFSVAAFLEPEIMLMDEILATADAEFRQRAINRLLDLSLKEGKTIIFVSHEMELLKNFCNKGLCLIKGRVQHQGDMKQVIHQYLSSVQPQGEGGSSEQACLYRLPPARHREDAFCLSSVTLLDSQEQLKPVLRTWEDATFRLCFWSPWEVPEGMVTMAIADASGHVLMNISTDMLKQSPKLSFAKGENRLDCHIPHIPLSPGTYRLGVTLKNTAHQEFFRENNLTFFHVSPAETDQFTPGITQETTPILLPHHWKSN